MIYEYFLSSINEYVTFSDDISLVRSLIQKRRLAVPILTSMNHTQDLHDFLYLIEDPYSLEEEDILRIVQRIRHLPWTIYRSPQFTLREFTLKDAKDLELLFSTPDIQSELQLSLAHDESLPDWISHYQEQVYRFYEYGLWGIEKDNHIIGIAGISPDKLELGYGILPAFRRQKIASTVCRQIISYAQDHLELSYLQAKVKGDNKPSLQLLTSLSFQQIGHDDSFLIYRLFL